MFRKIRKVFLIGLVLLIVFKGVTFIFGDFKSSEKFNNQRIHESLDYMTPIEYRELNTMKLGKVS